MPKALITGINGQDGSYLSEILLDKGYEVIGTVKRNSVAETQTSRIDHLRDAGLIKLEYADLIDLASLIKVLALYKPDEIYNLAAQSHVRISFDQPIYTAHATGLGVLNILEAVKLVVPEAKVYQASSSEIFGNQIDPDGFQRETTAMHPVSPYGCSKLFGYNITRNYRNAYNLWAVNGILFNHCSPNQGTNFAPNKIAKAAAKIKLGLQKDLQLGNLEASRDWGHARDFCEAMHLILNAPKPDDYVCSSGESHTVRELCQVCFSIVGLNWENYVKSGEARLLRPEELNFLKGDSTKLRTELGWEPKYTWDGMLEEMVKYWIESLTEW